MILFRFLAAIALSMAVPALAADAYPSRAIKVVVPQEPGGTVDTVTRYVVERLEARLASPVVVENRPGAGGTIGTEHVARASPDGYTLLAASTNTMAMAPYVLRSVRYDPLRDFVPIVNVADAITVVVATPALPVRSLAELASYSRSHPGKVNYGSAGIGSSNHLMAEYFKSLSGADLVHIPYRGAPQAITALVTGDVQVMFLTAGTALPQVQGGKVSPLAVSGDVRLAALPGVPTAAEAGYASFDVRLWVGLMAPLGTPVEVVDRVNREINAVLREPETVRWLVATQHRPLGGTPSDFAATLRSDRALWASLVAKARIEPQ